MALARYDLTVQDAQGRALSGALVYFCSQPANTSIVPPSPLATIYSDINGDILANPVTTDGFGHVDAYLTAGTPYTVVITNPLFLNPLIYIDQQASSGTGGIGYSPVNASTTAGTITGSDTTWTLPSPPVAGSLVLTRNGQVLTPAVAYTISGATFTLSTTLSAGEILNANYFTT